MSGNCKPRNKISNEVLHTQVSRKNTNEMGSQANLSRSGHDDITSSGAWPENRNKDSKYYLTKRSELELSKRVTTLVETKILKRP